MKPGDDCSSDLESRSCVGPLVCCVLLPALKGAACYRERFSSIVDCCVVVRSEEGLAQQRPPTTTMKGIMQGSTTLKTLAYSYLYAWASGVRIVSIRSSDGGNTWLTAERDGMCGPIGNCSEYECSITSSSLLPVQRRLQPDISSYGCCIEPVSFISNRQI
jgi:hypothetical protein